MLIDQVRTFVATIQEFASWFQILSPFPVNGPLPLNNITVYQLTNSFLSKLPVSLPPQLQQLVFCGTQGTTGNMDVQFHKSPQTNHLCKHHHSDNHGGCSSHHNLGDSYACVDSSSEYLFDIYHMLQLIREMIGQPAEK